MVTCAGVNPRERATSSWRPSNLRSDAMTGRKTKGNEIEVRTSTEHRAPEACERRDPGDPRTGRHIGGECKRESEQHSQESVSGKVGAHDEQCRCDTDHETHCGHDGCQREGTKGEIESSSLPDLVDDVVETSRPGLDQQIHEWKRGDRRRHEGDDHRDRGNPQRCAADSTGTGPRIGSHLSRRRHFVSSPTF